MFDRIMYFLIAVFYGLLLLDILPGSLTSMTHKLIEPEMVQFHAVGILGMFCMLFFIVYWLRKHNIIRAGKPIDYLKAHIFLALIGGGLSLVHATFKLSALNSKLLVSAMTLIITSGVIGKYLFSRIMSLKSGVDLELNNMKTELAGLLENASSVLTDGHKAALQSLLLPQPAAKNPGFFIGLAVLIVRDIRIWIESGRKLRAIFIVPDGPKHLEIARKAVKLDNRIKVLLLTKNLFSQWKKVHLPFTVILLLTLLIHIVSQFMFGNVQLFK